MTMADKYFWRLRFAGMYHYFIEDIPHLLISVPILFHAAGRGGSFCGQCIFHSDSAFAPDSDQFMTYVLYQYGQVGDSCRAPEFAGARICLTLSSIVFRILNKW